MSQTSEPELEGLETVEAEATLKPRLCQGLALALIEGEAVTPAVVGLASAIEELPALGARGVRAKK